MIDGFIEYIERYVVPGFWLLLAEDYEEDYPLSVAHCGDRFDEPEAHDLTGNERRARTETSFKLNAERFAHRGMAVSSQRNDGGHRHREIKAGPVILTQSFADSPGALVQQANFRDTLARSRQTSLLDKDYDEPKGDLLYGIVLHGVRRVGERQRRYDQFGFLQLAIPNRDCSAYLDVINLAQRYADHEVDPADIAAMMERGVPIEPQRRPSPVFRQYRRRSTDES